MQNDLEEQFEAVGAIINRARLANGWKKKPTAEIIDTIEEWMKIFSHYKIPTVYLDNLYFRAFEAKQTAVASGKPSPEMNAELLVANWTGASGLKSELERLRIEEENRANPNGFNFINDGKIKCHYCLGTGFREVSRFGLKGFIRCHHEENYTPGYGDEVVGIEEGIEIIKTHLASRGIEFSGNAQMFTNVVRGEFPQSKSQTNR